MGNDQPHNNLLWYVCCSLGWIYDGRQTDEVLLVFILAICLRGIQCEEEVQKLTLYNSRTVSP